MDQRFFAAPHGFSQLSTSFIAIACLGIHRTPLLTFPCMACTRIVHAIQAMSSILCYLAFYHTIHLRRALRGPTHPLLSNMSKNSPPPLALRGRCNRPGRRSPARPTAKKQLPRVVYSFTKEKLSHCPWSYRDSNPRSTASQRQHPCTTSLNQHSPGKALTSQNQNTVWSYRDSNPGPLPCKGSALAS